MSKKLFLSIIASLPGAILSGNIIEFALFGVGFLPEVTGDGMAFARICVWAGSYAGMALIYQADWDEEKRA